MTKLPNSELSNKEKIVGILQKEKPETIDQLVKLVQQQSAMPENEIVKLVIQLENEGKIHLSNREQTPSTLQNYLFSSLAGWFWATIALAIAATAASLTIPENSYPLLYVRQILGVTFVLLLPGYAFIKALFPTQVPVKTGSESLDTIERIALSIGMSLALVPLIGLLLNYTPWGITLAPIVLCLTVLTAAFAIVATLREYHNRPLSANKLSA